MTAPEIEFHVTGPDARRLADELAEIMAAELGTPPRRLTEGDFRSIERFRSADPVAVAALILLVPGAVLAAADHFCPTPFAISAVHSINQHRMTQTNVAWAVTI